MASEKIDMVYLWCDGNDPEFKRRKDECQGITHTPEQENVSGTVRFYNNDELKYALRSLEKYAPWINHVYIVTDRQVPHWLDESYDRVTVVDHSEIMPKECIPCFNSATIEQFLPFIPGLEEKFLYGNDDMFFGAPVVPEDFYKGDKSIVRVEKRNSFMKFKRSLEKLLGTYDKNVYTFNRTILNSIDLLERDYGKGTVYSSFHNIDAYTKTGFIATLNRFAKEFKKCEAFRFRDAETLQRVIFGLDAVYAGNGVMEIVNSGNTAAAEFGYYGKEDKLPQAIKRMEKNPPKVFCLQAAYGFDLQTKLNCKAFMEKLFPEPSKFEKKE